MGLTRWKRLALEGGAVAGGFSLLTLFMLWPFPEYFTTRVLGPPGDNLYYVWLLGWFEQALFDLHINPLFVPFHQFPDGWKLAYSEITLANAIPGALLARVTTPAVAYNVLVLSSFVLTGLTAYFGVSRLASSRTAGWFAGAALSFCAFRLAHMLGHLPLIMTHWMVLHYLALFLMLQRTDRRMLYAVLSAVGLGLAALSSMYVLYMCLIASAACVVSFILFDRTIVADRSLWRAFGLLAAVATPFVALAMYPYLELAMAGEGNRHTLGAMQLYSASLSDYAIPPMKHLWWGDAVVRAFGADYWIEKNVYAGFTTLVLAMVPLFVKKDRTNRVLWWSLAVACAVCVAFSLGLSLRWMNRDIMILGHTIPMPGRYVVKILPFFDAMRALARFSVLAMIFLSTLAGLGVAELTRRIRRPAAQAAFAVAVVGLALFEVVPRVDHFTPVAPRPVDEWLARQQSPGAVAELPADQLSNPVGIYGSLFHRKPLFGVFYGAYYPRDFVSLMKSVEAFPGGESLAILRARGVRYVVFRRDTAAGAAPPEIPPDLVPAYADSDVTVYLLEPPLLSRSCPALCRGSDRQGDGAGVFPAHGAIAEGMDRQFVTARLE